MNKIFNTPSFFTPQNSFKLYGIIGTDIMHASDGSDLYMEWTWNMEDNTGVWNITGGTGRFVNASGYFNLAGHPDPDNPKTRFIVDSGVGMISNVGKGK